MTEIEAAKVSGVPAPAIDVPTQRTPPPPDVLAMASTLAVEPASGAPPAPIVVMPPVDAMGPTGEGPAPTFKPPPPKPAGKGFGETAWFKQGEVQAALAQQESTSADPLAPTGKTGQQAAISGSDLSAEDRARLSLKSGQTNILPAVKPSTVPGDRMNESDMLAELNPSKKRLMLAGIAAGLVLIGVLILVLRGKHEPTPVLPGPVEVPVERPSSPPAVAASPSSPVAAPASPASPAAAPASPAAPKPKAPAPKVGELLRESEAALKREDYKDAVDNYIKAVQGGAEGKDARRVEAAINKALAAKLTRAKNTKDKLSEGVAKSQLARMKKAGRRR
jgi:hypothetical protein